MATERPKPESFCRGTRHETIHISVLGTKTARTAYQHWCLYPVGFSGKTASASATPGVSQPSGMQSISSNLLPNKCPVNWPPPKKPEPNGPGFHFYVSLVLGFTFLYCFDKFGQYFHGVAMAGADLQSVPATSQPQF
jgi:hypothetical protein